MIQAIGVLALSKIKNDRENDKSEYKEEADSSVVFTLRDLISFQIEVVAHEDQHQTN
jgi:hypothetical protein